MGYKKNTLVYDSHTKNKKTNTNTSREARVQATQQSLLLPKTTGVLVGSVQRERVGISFSLNNIQSLGVQSTFNVQYYEEWQRNSPE